MSYLGVRHLLRPYFLGLPNPGETVTLWATGLGAVSVDESQPAQQADLTNSGFSGLKFAVGGWAPDSRSVLIGKPSALHNSFARVDPDLRVL